MRWIHGNRSNIIRRKITSLVKEKMVNQGDKDNRNFKIFRQRIH